ncbi:MAG: hypothetical protein J5509_06940 [Lachnospiraceae bacterium]|nr:hypothetical protein [Lachnospiraceae bacterium]
MQEDRTLIKFKDSLIVSGTGVMVFGFWVVIKSVLMLVFQRGEVNELVDHALDDPEERKYIYLVMVIILVIIIGIRSYIGLSARADGFGRKKSMVYVIVAVAVLIFEVWATIDSLSKFDGSSFDDIMDRSIEVLVDITTYIVMIQMIISSIAVRYLRRKKSEASHE